MTPAQATFLYLNCAVLAFWGIFAWGWHERPWRSLALITAGSGIGVLFGSDWSTRNGYPVGPSPFGGIIILAAAAILVRGERAYRQQQRSQRRAGLAQLVETQPAAHPLPPPKPRRRRRRRIPRV